MSNTLPGGLYALCDDGVRPGLSLEEKARRLLEGGVQVLQLRLKRTSTREAVAAARTISHLCRERGAVCLVNDRADWALVAGAHGVHLGDEDLPPADARKVLGPKALIGVTARNLADVEAARAAGADYCGVGPVYATRSKTVNAPVLGIPAFQALAAKSPLPLVAIAGIDLARIAEVAAAGAHGAAVLSDLLEAEDIAGRARALSAEFERGRNGRTVGRTS